MPHLQKISVKYAMGKLKTGTKVSLVEDCTLQVLKCLGEATLRVERCGKARLMTISGVSVEGCKLGVER